MAFLLGIPAMIGAALGSISIMHWVALIAVFSVWFYFHMSRDFGKFEKMGLKAVKPNIFFGSQSEMFMGKVNFVDQEQIFYNALKQDGIGVVYQATEPTIYVTDPDLMKQIQITDFDHFVDMGFMNPKVLDVPINQIGLANTKGDEWRKFKAAVTPAFRLKHMRNISANVNACAIRLISHMEKSVGKDEVDFEEITSLFTLDCICSSAFSLEINTFNDPNSEMVKMAKGMIEEWRFMLAMLAPELSAKFGLAFLNPKCVNFFKGLSRKLIAERKTMANPPQDILGIMLKARENQLEGEDLSDQMYISDERIAETCMQFFLDGHTTVALLLKMTCYFLALNPEAQERAYEEVEEFNSKHGDNINKDNISELTYLDQVQCETLRIANFPTAARTVTKPWKVPGYDCVLPVGTRVTCNFGGIMLDEDYYPEPMRFDPDRFSPENKKNIKPMTYQPFGAGPRMCIGVQIAKMETQVFLYHVLKNFKLAPGKDTKPDLKWKIYGMMEPEGGVSLKLTKRNA